MAKVHLTKRQLAGIIDHSLLDPPLTDRELEEGCKLADEYGCATVCVKPYHVKRASELLKNSEVKVSTVIGFPHGSNLTEIKCMEAEKAIEQGCEELDMVMNIGAFKSQYFDYVRDDIKAVVDLAHEKGVIVKVILENGYLSPDEIRKACAICKEADADFVKTATGYGPGGATVADIKIMREAAGKDMYVKAAKGIRTYESAMSFIEAGADRVAARATKAIVDRCPWD